MNEVWLGYKCYYDCCDVWETVEVVFTDELKAMLWEEEFKSTEFEWREIKKFEVTK